MQSKRIKYFSYRGCTDSIKRRNNSPAADTKIDYIIEVLNRCGYGVDHISRAESSINKCLPGYVEKKGCNTYRYFASLRKTSSVLRVVNRWMVDLQFFLWCLLNIKKGETILVYHSLGYDSAFIMLKRLKNFTLIGDIEEIYQDVHRQSKSKSRNEYKFIDICDKFMFPNTLLNSRLNRNNRPYLVVHGIYKNEDKIVSHFDDGNIHLLYAGTFDPVKGGVNAAIEVAKFLPIGSHLHITGFGTTEQIEETKKNICDAESVSSYIITYHGFLPLTDIKKLMQQCHIGLCTQDPSTLLNLTSFPSKILNYMANGLNVISGRNAAIEESYVGDLIQYYDNQNPQEIAAAILISVIDGTKNQERLKKLDCDFANGLSKLLGK